MSPGLVSTSEVQLLSGTLHRASAGPASGGTWYLRFCGLGALLSKLLFPAFVNCRVVVRAWEQDYSPKGVGRRIGDRQRRIHQILVDGDPKRQLNIDVAGVQLINTLCAKRAITRPGVPDRTDRDLSAGRQREVSDPQLAASSPIGVEEKHALRSVPLAGN
jgi:hypothetical protein